MTYPEHIQGLRFALAQTIPELRARAHAVAQTSAKLAAATHTRWQLALSIPAYLRKGHPDTDALHAEWQAAQAAHTRHAAEYQRLLDRPEVYLPQELTWVRICDLPPQWRRPDDALADPEGRIAVVAMLVAEG